MHDFLQNPQILNIFSADSQKLRKKAVTLARLPEPHEMGTAFSTYVADASSPDGVRLEIADTIGDAHVICRNPDPLPNGQFNEWLQPFSEWRKNYGELPSRTEFSPFKKIALIDTIEITDEVLSLLGSTDGTTATISVSWSPNGMVVFKGGRLAKAGYGIAPQELASTYEPA